MIGEIKLSRFEEGSVFKMLTELIVEMTAQICLALMSQKIRLQNLYLQNVKDLFIEPGPLA